MRKDDVLVEGDWLEEQLDEPVIAAPMGYLAVAAGLMIRKRPHGPGVLAGRAARRRRRTVHLCLMRTGD